MERPCHSVPWSTGQPTRPPFLLVPLRHGASVTKQEWREKLERQTMRKNGKGRRSSANPPRSLPLSWLLAPPPFSHLTGPGEIRRSQASPPQRCLPLSSRPLRPVISPDPRSGKLHRCLTPESMTADSFGHRVPCPTLPSVLIGPLSQRPRLDGSPVTLSPGLLRPINGPQVL
jgi:hypothetical protein